MPRAIDVPDGETVKLVAGSDSQGRYEFEVFDNEIRVSDRLQDAPDGRRVETQRTGYFIKDRDTEEIYAHAPNGDASIEIAKSRFEINLSPSLTLNSSRQNQDGLVGDTISPGAGGSTFASQNVPDGYEVLVQNAPGNSDNVEVQDDGGSTRLVLEPNDAATFGVSNLDQITVVGTGNNPTIHAIVEAP